LEGTKELRAFLGLYPGYCLDHGEELRRQTYAVAASVAITSIDAKDLARERVADIAIFAMPHARRSRLVRFVELASRGSWRTL
jgi:hypothetical protein